MKYKEIFKSWWFYTMIVTYSIICIHNNIKNYGSLYLAEYIGIFLGSFLGVLAMASLFWGLFNLSKKLFKKKK